ncbi:MAG: hypothetical protein M1819_006494 [Sarea resinae]|nr:MAG: hypothetical protein M1819_006494 [Sarea resinae]
MSNHQPNRDWNQARHDRRQAAQTTIVEEDARAGQQASRQDHHDGDSISLALTPSLTQPATANHDIFSNNHAGHHTLADVRPEIDPFGSLHAGIAPRPLYHITSAGMTNDPNPNNPIFVTGPNDDLGARNASLDRTAFFTSTRTTGGHIPNSAIVHLPSPTRASHHIPRTTTPSSTRGRGGGSGRHIPIVIPGYDHGYSLNDNGMEEIELGPMPVRSLPDQQQPQQGQAEPMCRADRVRSMVRQQLAEINDVVEELESTGEEMDLGQRGRAASKTREPEGPKVAWWTANK